MNDGRNVFLKPTLRGGRFSEHSVPVEVLPELMIYQEFVVALAKHIFLEQNPDRQRVPKGFSDQLQLRLREIKDNCATPILERVDLGHQTQLPLQHLDPFEQARGLINEAIESVHAGNPLPATFPEKFLSYFNRLGSHLLDDESMELIPPNQSTGPKLDSVTRRALVAKTKAEYLQTVSLRGVVRFVDKTSQNFIFETELGSKVRVSMPVQHEVNILEAFRHYRSQQVKVVGEGVSTADGAIQSIHKVDSLEIEDRSPDVLARLEELKQMQAGWLDGVGEPVDTDLIENVENRIGRLVAFQNLPNPYTYPTLEGGLRLEWDIDDWAIEVEFEIDGTVNASAFKTSSDDAFEQEWSWRDSKWEDHVSEFVAQFLGVEE